jgi:hypothetical protein
MEEELLAVGYSSKDIQIAIEPLVQNCGDNEESNPECLWWNAGQVKECGLIHAMGSAAVLHAELPGPLRDNDKGAAASATFLSKSLRRIAKELFPSQKS